MAWQKAGNIGTFGKTKLPVSLTLRVYWFYIFHHYFWSGIPIDMVGGTSMGSFVGAAYAESGDVNKMCQKVREWSMVRMLASFSYFLGIPAKFPLAWNVPGAVVASGSAKFADRWAKALQKWCVIILPRWNKNPFQQHVNAFTRSGCEYNAV